MTSLSEVMTETVFTVNPDDTMASAAQAMVRGRFGSVLVTRGQMLSGILTERDVLRAASKSADMSSAAVKDWMTPEPITAPPAMDSDDAAELMLSSGFRHLPVVDDEGGIAGIVSLRDVLSARIRR